MDTNREEKNPFTLARNQILYIQPSLSLFGVSLEALAYINNRPQILGFQVTALGQCTVHSTVRSTAVSITLFTLNSPHLYMTALRHS